jgi:Glycosyl transferases group 1
VKASPQIALDAELPAAAGRRSEPAEVLPDPLRWLRQREARMGRPLRVLHVGNIAGNAYVAAKKLREVGVAADVLASEWYHVMACPEWEELALRRDWGDDYAPQIAAADLANYRRPRWFVQGPLASCAFYLRARLDGRKDCENRIWRLLPVACAQGLRAKNAQLRIEETFSRSRWLRAQRGRTLRAVIDTVERWARLGGQAVRAIGFVAARGPWRALLAIVAGLGFAAAADTARERVRRGLARRRIAAIAAPKDHITRRFERLVEEFARRFPDRADRLTLAELQGYHWNVSVLQSLFAEYDIVQAYGVEPILPLLCGKRPYVAFEHGTLRDFIRDDVPLHRMSALAYRSADHVFVTNGDCLEHARWLGIERLTPMIHPIDIDQHERRDEAEIARIRARYSADVLLLCPIRHDWAVKGTDIHIRALPLIRRRLAARIVLLLSPWGQQLSESRRLIAQLGCEDSVAWIERPMSRPILISHIQAADLVLDQLALPHFGATAPQAIAAGTPVVMSYRPESTAWIVGEPAPILSAFTPEEVAAAVVQGLDPVWRSQFRKEARRWIHRYHHHDRMVLDHLRAYREVLETRNDG